MKVFKETKFIIVCLLTIFYSVNTLANDETIDLTQQGYKNAQTVGTVQGTNFTAIFSQGSHPNPTYAPSYYNSDKSVHCYEGNTLTITSNHTITNIKFTGCKNTKNFSFNNISASVGTYTGKANAESATWKGSSTKVVFSVKGGKCSFSTITVTYSAKEVSGLSFQNTDVAAVQGMNFSAPTLNNPNNLPVTYSSDNTEVAQVDASTGAVTIVGTGNSNITASFAGNEAFDAGQASYKLQVIQSSDVYTVKQILSMTSLPAEEIFVKGVVANVEDFNSEDNYITYFISDDGSNSNQLQITNGKGVYGSDIISQDDIARGDILIVKGTLSINANTKEMTNASIVNNNECADQVTISEAGWATYVSRRSIDFTNSNVQAFSVSYDRSNDLITLNEVTTIPGKTVVVLKASPATYTFNHTHNATALTDNALEYSCSDKVVEAERTIYVLALNNGTIGFWPVIAGDTVAAYKGYLEINNATSKNFFGFDGNTSDVNDIKAHVSHEFGRYNLAGQRVRDGYKGLVIVNGNKIVVK